MNEKIALVAGATGLVGQYLVDALLASPIFTTVRALSRRPLPEADPRLEIRVVDFDALTADPVPIEAHAAFCALGTTIKKAGSQEAFRRVDLEYPLAVARAARAGGAAHFLLVSALGADPDSSIFYNRIKGEVEQEILGLGYPSATIVRPSLLLGHRDESRPAERAAQIVLGALSPLMAGPLRRYRPVHARDVAKTLVRAAEQGGEGVRIIESDDIPARSGPG